MISLVINLDSRPGFMENETVQGLMMNGTRSLDFFTEGVKNKVKFFEGHNLETTVFIDVHDPLPKETMDWLTNEQANGIIDNLVFNRHTEKFLGEGFQKFNDISFLNAMVISRGDIIVHADGDASVFINDKSVINEWLAWLTEGRYDFICYPSKHSPDPVVDPDFDYFWASTRWTMFRRESLDYTELVKCLMDSDYLYGKYGDRKRKCPWLEHLMSLINGPAKVFYPPYQLERYIVFCWSKYISGTLGRLNAAPYHEVLEYIKKCGGISYPNDVGARP